MKKWVPEDYVYFVKKKKKLSELCGRDLYTSEQGMRAGDVERVLRVELQFFS